MVSSRIVTVDLEDIRAHGDAGCPDHAVRVGTAAGTAHRAAYSPAHAYEFGLQVILDGSARSSATVAGRRFK
jgi:hypothetical protein